MIGILIFYTVDYTNKNVQKKESLWDILKIVGAMAKIHTGLVKFLNPWLPSGQKFFRFWSPEMNYTSPKKTISLER